MNYPLNHPDAHTIHEEIIDKIIDNYSLTITLNPSKRLEFCSSQYNNLLRELKALFKLCSPYYRRIMITPEFTSEMNCHFHCYFNTDSIIYFEQFFKANIKNYKWIGKVYKLKKIDEISDELLKYPFKDIEKTLYLDKGIPFNPKHWCFYGDPSSIKPEATKPTGSISIAKFIEFIEKNKNI